MGDITNLGRRQSEAELPQASHQIHFAGTEKQLSFRQFKNPHRGTTKQLRERSGEKSSNEEAIRSEIASDMHIEHSDECALNSNLYQRGATSGRDFSCIFDADSEGPKRDKTGI